jgi:hypothetical protein
MKKSKAIDKLSPAFDTHTPFQHGVPCVNSQKSSEEDAPCLTETPKCGFLWRMCERLVWYAVQGAHFFPEMNHGYLFEML